MSLLSSSPNLYKSQENTRPQGTRKEKINIPDTFKHMLFLDVDDELTDALLGEIVKDKKDKYP